MTENRSETELNINDRLSDAMSYFVSLVFDSEHTEMPDSITDISEAERLSNVLTEIRNALYMAKKGDFSFIIKNKGFISGSLKALQSNLKDIAWVTQQVANGDFTQKMHFMGEFSSAFNSMTELLAQSNNELNEQKEKLREQNLKLNEQKEQLREQNLKLNEQKEQLREQNLILNEQKEQLREQNLKLNEESKILNEQKEHFSYRALHDPLTGLKNRAYFDELLLNEIARAKRSSSLLAIVIVDLDKFKQVNDTMGHQAGDALLIEVASRLLKGTREIDTVARLGGDEFGMIWPSYTSNLQHFIRIKDRLISHINAHLVIGGAEYKLSVSMGISIYPYDGEEPLTLLKVADNAMYEAKKMDETACIFASWDKLNKKSLY